VTRSQRLINHFSSQHHIGNLEYNAHLWPALWITQCSAVTLHTAFVDINRADRKICVKVTLTSALIKWVYNLSLCGGGGESKYISLTSFERTAPQSSAIIFLDETILTSPCTNKYYLSSNLVSVKRCLVYWPEINYVRTCLCGAFRRVLCVLLWNYLQVKAIHLQMTEFLRSVSL